MENTKKYFVIEEHKWSYPKEHFKYNIMKDKAFTLNEATKMLIAYEQLNDNEDVKYHLQEVDLLLNSEPLILKDEVKENGISEEMPF
jgi:thiaminase